MKDYTLKIYTLKRNTNLNIQLTGNRPVQRTSKWSREEPTVQSSSYRVWSSSRKCNIRLEVLTPFKIYVGHSHRHTSYILQNTYKTTKRMLDTLKIPSMGCTTLYALGAYYPQLIIQLPRCQRWTNSPSTWVFIDPFCSCVHTYSVV